MKKVNKIFLVMIAIFIISLSTVYAVDKDYSYEGSGIEKDPYILNFSKGFQAIEIEYGNLPNKEFYFKIDGGKYLVEINNDREKEKVVFTKTNVKNGFRVGAYINAGTQPYVQAGAVTEAVMSEPGTSEKGYEITTKEKFVDIKKGLSGGNFYNGEVTSGAYNIDLNSNTNIQDGMLVLNVENVKNGGARNDLKYGSLGTHKEISYALKNAIVDGVASSKNYYVLTSNGTVKDLYFEESKSNFEGHGLPIVRHVLGEGGVTRWEVAISTSNVPSKYYFATFATEEKGSSNKILSELDITYKFKADSLEDTAGPIQKAVTWVLIGVGELLMLITRAFLGTDLTIDSIIFNKYDATVLDLKAILYGTGTARGMFGNTAVIGIINNIYFAFQKLAIVAYIVILLYIGVKVLSSVGTVKQNKSFKYIENWVIGVIILFIAPRFFHYLTDISNSIVNYIGEGTNPYYSQYNIVSMLGQDALIGENAHTAELEELIKEGIASRQGQIEGITKDMLEQEEYAKKVFEEQKNSINYRDNVLRNSAAAGIARTRDTCYQNGNVERGDYYKRELDFLIESNVSVEGMLETLQNYIDEHKEELANGDSNISKEYNEKREFFEQLVGGYVDQGEGLAQIVDDYYNSTVGIAKLSKEVTSLQDYLNGGSKTDLMGEMRVRAGTTGKLVYALVWLALIIELYSILGMYYKRIIIVTILIMIFPLVMITYAIDKSGDGAAQTLETWVKEFTVNIIVQIFHAVIYVVLIQSGMDIYEANNNNWLFFFLAVIFLFPAERILRSIFGMNGSTVGTLKANVMSKVGAGFMAFGMAKNATRLARRGIRATTNFAKDAKNNGVKQAIKDRKDKFDNAIEADRKKREAETSKKRKAAQTRADSRKKLRDNKIAYRAAKYSAADPRRLMMNGLAHARNGLYHAGNATRKIKSGVDKVTNNKYVNKAYKLTKGAIKHTNGFIKKASGIAAGATAMVDNVGKGNLAGAITGGISVGRKTGGFKTQNKLPKTPKQIAKAQQRRRQQQIPQTKANMPGGQKPLGSVNGTAKKPSRISTVGAAGGRATIRGFKKTTTKKNIKMTHKKANS